MNVHAPCKCKHDFAAHTHYRWHYWCALCSCGEFTNNAQSAQPSFEGVS